MNRLIVFINIFLIVAAACVLNKIGFFANANWPVIRAAAVIELLLGYFSFKAIIHRINYGG